MKKLYYFSKSSLQYIEIKNFRSKFTIFLSSLIVLFLFLVVSGTIFITSAYRPNKPDNSVLKDKLDIIVKSYSRINNSLDSLIKVNNDLRIAANLPPISDDENSVGVGGGYFDNTIDFSKDINSRLKKAVTLVDEITRKFEFEKVKYSEISSKIAENKVLFESIPAIKPCDGTLSEHGFGMRIHPILNVLKMHEGIDIVTEIGTPVHATGKGVIDFTGIKGAYGLCVEINHGFGYTTIYGHLSTLNVQVGQKVLRGTVIAQTGNSGLSTGPHLHYEVSHDGIKLDPVGYFFDDSNHFALNHKN